jgi:hypothetical protein
VSLQVGRESLEESQKARFHTPQTRPVNERLRKLHLQKEGQAGESIDRRRRPFPHLRHTNRDIHRRQHDGDNDPICTKAKDRKQRKRIIPKQSFRSLEPNRDPGNEKKKSNREQKPGYEEELERRRPWPRMTIAHPA